MKTYSTKANANRAAKTAGLEAGAFNVIEIDGRFAIQVIEADLFDEAEAEAEYKALQARQAEIAQEAEEAAALWLASFVPYNPQLLLPAPQPVFNGLTYCPKCGIHLSNGYNTEVGHEDGDVYCLACDHVLLKGKLVKSSVDNPVKMVWEIADRMWGQRRKDIIAECVRLGIAYNTARTQYQAFYKVKSQEGKN